MVEYLTDWVMGTSNQAADDDVKYLTRYSFRILGLFFIIEPFILVVTHGFFGVFVA